MYQWLSHKVNNLQTRKDVFSIDIVIVFCPSMLPFRIFRKMSKFDFKINSIQPSEENKCYKYRIKIGSHYFGHMKGHTKLINHIFGPMNIESQSSKIATSQKLHINTDKYHLPQFAWELVYAGSCHCNIYAKKVPIFLQQQKYLPLTYQDCGKLYCT